MEEQAEDRVRNLGRKLARATADIISKTQLSSPVLTYASGPNHDLGFFRPFLSKSIAEAISATKRAEITSSTYECDEIGPLNQRRSVQLILHRSPRLTDLLKLGNDLKHLKCMRGYRIEPWVIQSMDAGIELREANPSLREWIIHNAPFKYGANCRLPRARGVAEQAREIRRKVSQPSRLRYQI